MGNYPKFAVLILVVMDNALREIYCPTRIELNVES